MLRLSEAKSLSERSERRVVSKADKQLQRLLTLPKDFSWEELVSVDKLNEHH